MWTNGLLRTAMPLFALVSYVLLAHIWAASPFALHQWDTFFDADANKYYQWFSEGRPDLNRMDGLHPLLAQLISWPIRLATWLFVQVNGGDVACLSAARLELALWVSPIAASLALSLQVRALQLMGCTPLRVIQLGLLSMLSIGMLVFGSLPEQFSLSCLALSWVIYLAARDLVELKIPVLWIILPGILATGVVISNFSIFVLLTIYLELRGFRRMGLALDGRRLIRVVMSHAAMIVIGTLVIAFACTWAERITSGGGSAPHLSNGLNGRFLLKQRPDDIAAAVMRLGADGFALGGISVVKQRDLPFPDQRDVSTLDNAAVVSAHSRGWVDYVIYFLAAAPILSGMMGWWNRDRMASYFFVSLWLLYVPVLTIYSGSDIFLFCLHILPVALVIMSSSVNAGFGSSLQGFGISVLMLVVTAVNFRTVSSLIDISQGPLK